VIDSTALPTNEPEDKPSISPLADEQFLRDLRSQMHKFASLQLGDAHLAEDAVQEALIGAMKNARTFAGRAALKTWVFAILKNKIADVLRQRHRFVDAGQLLREDAEQSDLDELFNRRGHWHAQERPARWADPEAAIHDKHFWRVFEACLNHLPGRQARVFMMREFIELESHEICAAADISVSNLNVTLHRARLRLRECLENNWFARGEAL
jgi:RNA polymerase sigma-70 factor (ECF subfamily)